MTLPFLPAKPALGSLRPMVPGFMPAPSGVASELAAVTGLDGSVLNMVTADHHADSDGCGFYRIDSDECRWFAKVVAATRHPQQVAAERLAEWLARRGMRVSATLPGFPRDWRRPSGALLHVFAYHYIDARFAKPSIEDVSALGALLAALHLALAVWPGAVAAKRAWDERCGALNRARGKVLSGELSAGPDPERLRALLAEVPFDVGGRRQVVHNDFHRANVLFPNDGTPPVLLDLEDACHSFQPPVIDIAKALERFILADAADDRQAFTLGRHFLLTYAAAGGPARLEREQSLFNVMRAQSVRALCELTVLTAMGQPTGVEEWHKFLYLLDRAEHWREVLRDLDRFWMEK